MHKRGTQPRPALVHFSARRMSGIRVLARFHLLLEAL